MSKLSLSNLASGFRSSNKLNENFQAIRDAFDNTLSRDGSTPNQMTAPLDMNSQRIINVGPPVNLSDAARLQDVLDLKTVSDGDGGVNIISPFMATVLDDTTATQARQTLGVEAGYNNLWTDPTFAVLGAAPLARQILQNGSFIPAVSVTSHNINNRAVLCQVADSTNLRVGQLLRFDDSAQAVLRFTRGDGERQMQRISAVTPTSFTIDLPFETPPSFSSACTVEVWTRGDTVGVTGNATEHTKKTPSLKCWVTDEPWALALFPGARRCLVFEKTVSTPEYVYFDMESAQSQAQIGKPRAVGMAVSRQNGNGTAKAFINDNSVVTYGTSHASPSRGWISCGKTASGGTVFAAGVEFSGEVGDRWVISTPCLVASLQCEDGVYTENVGEEVFVQASISPFINTEVVFPSTFGVQGYEWTINAKRQSNGKLTEGVRSCFITMEVVGNAVAQTWDAFDYVTRVETGADAQAAGPIDGWSLSSGGSLDGTALNLTTGIFTAPRSGYYQFNLLATPVENMTNRQWGVRARRNGVANTLPQMEIVNLASSSMSFVAKMDANDTWQWETVGITPFDSAASIRFLWSGAMIRATDGDNRLNPLAVLCRREVDDPTNYGPVVFVPTVTNVGFPTASGCGELEFKSNTTFCLYTNVQSASTRLNWDITKVTTR